MIDYLSQNRAAWNAKTRIHIESEFYDMASFLKGKNSLNHIELELIGNVQSKTILHLQCHFGQDTLSLGRMGASVTGVDLSDQAIENAKKKIAAQINVPAEFICCNLYDLPAHLEKKFDLVFTTYGTIGWLPDLDKWAKIVSGYLKPGGKLIFVEFHPVVWMYDNEITRIEYDYFQSEPIVETEQGTYADSKANLETVSVSWNHGMAEVLTSILQNGLEINSVGEYDYSPYNCFKKLSEQEPGKFRFNHIEKRIPMVLLNRRHEKINSSISF